MPPLAATSFTGICAKCTRRLLQSAPSLSAIGHSQIRGKSRVAKKVTTIAIRLRQDLPEYGRKGSIVPMLFGQMRNYYYPQRIADYITPAEKLQLKKDGVVVTRDTTFGRAIPGSSAIGTSSTEDTSAVPKYDLKTVSPADAFELLEDTIPATLDFYRTPIASESERRAPDAAVEKEEAAQQAAPPPGVSPRQSPDNIYGSVSTADVNMAVKALLQTRGMHGLVVLPDEDIKFVNLVGTDTEAQRLKKLGTYEYEIRVKGHRQVLNRTVRVLPDDVKTDDTMSQAEAAISS